jgi:hypothetical protein
MLHEEQRVRSVARSTEAIESSLLNEMVCDMFGGSDGLTEYCTQYKWHYLFSIPNENQYFHLILLHKAAFD